MIEGAVGYLLPVEAASGSGVEGRATLFTPAPCHLDYLDSKQTVHVRSVPPVVVVVVGTDRISYISTRSRLERSTL